MFTQCPVPLRSQGWLYATRSSSRPRCRLQPFIDEAREHQVSHELDCRARSWPASQKKLSVATSSLLERLRRGSGEPDGVKAKAS